jgi:multidrug efflux pump subunit AcrA (membrane-fusion protein)
VAQAPGQVVWKSPKLKSGEFVEEGEELLRLDEREFVLALSKAKADTDKIRARLVELETNMANVDGQLDLLREAVAYNEKELTRQRNLFESKAVSASMVEQQRITVLEQQRAPATLPESHDAMPSQIDFQRAELAAGEAAIRQAELNLEYTVFRAPFRGRLDQVTAEPRQYVPTGQVLLELDSTAAAEVSIGVSPLRLAMMAGVQLENVIEAMVEKRGPPKSARFRVVTDNGNGGAEWVGRFGRIGASVDSATRMIKVVVIVNNPYEKQARGTRSRFPLGKGAFCTVVAYGFPQNDRLVIPRQAIHDGTVYLATSDSRLEMREVSVDYYLIYCPSGQTFR